MKLKWYGHASFLVTSGDGVSIITDPYTPEISGYRPVTDSPDIVITSSDTDSYHCRADLIPGDPIVINALDLAGDGAGRVEKGVEFRAIHAMEAYDHPEHDPEQNALYRFEVDGISIAHMGDVGNALTETQMAFFDGVDILLALTGGPPVIRLDDLMAVIKRVRPPLIVPMHFRTLRWKLRTMHWISTFLDYFDAEDVDFAFDYEVSLSPDDLPEQTRVLVLSYV